LEAATPMSRAFFLGGVAALALTAGLTFALPAASDALVQPGVVVQDVQLPRLSGGRQRLFGDAPVHLLIFFRPGERSRETLRELAACENDLRSRSVSVVGIVSSGVPAAEVTAFVSEIGFAAPVLVDEGDSLYGALEVVQHPAVVLTDRERRVFAVQPYMKLRFCDLLLARVKRQLGEIDDAQLQAVVDPGRMPAPSDDKAAVARRHVMLGNKQVEKGNCAGAVKSFDAALAADPTNAEAVAGKQRCEPPR
jgi:hypothetical protein